MKKLLYLLVSMLILGLIFIGCGTQITTPESTGVTESLSKASVAGVWVEDVTTGNASHECGQVGCCNGDCGEGINPFHYKIEDWDEDHGKDGTEGGITISNSDGNNFDFSSTWPISCVMVKGPAFANYYVYCYETPVFGDTNLTFPLQQSISHVTFCGCEGACGYEELTVTKTAVNSYTREHFWDIDKKVETENEYTEDCLPKIWLYVDGHGDETAIWNVDVTYKGFEDSGWKVEGTITIKNTGTLDAVITEIRDILTPHFIGPVEIAGTWKPLGLYNFSDESFEIPYTLPAGATLTCNYSSVDYSGSEPDWYRPANVDKPLPEPEDLPLTTKNRVYVYTTNTCPTPPSSITEPKPYSDSVPLNWEVPSTELYAVVEVTDTNLEFANIYDLNGGVFLDAADYEEGDVENFQYTKEFRWNDYGQEECGDHTYENIAKVLTGCDNIIDTASATLKVNVQCINWETAYAMDECGAECFIDNGFNNWGWTNEVQVGIGGCMDLWAAAGQCDTDKGMLVGSVSVNWEGDCAIVEYDVDSPYILDETHVYVGCTMFPLVTQGKKMVETVAPGQYYEECPLECDSAWVIAHAVVGIPDPNFGP